MAVSRHRSFRHRLATLDDLSSIAALMDAAISIHFDGLLDAAQVELSRSVMGLDTSLVTDGAYFLVEDEETGRLAGCGGWSRRATLYGGDHSTRLRDETLLDPQRDAARIRAMYTHPDFARQGIGRKILGLCEDAARAAGFLRVELMATISGEPLYRACGYADIERIVAASRDGVAVPGLRMGKVLTPET